MNHRLKNTDLEIQVNQIGMELSSIRSITSGKEYLWQGNPTFWAGQAPLLFPIIGALKDGQTLISGKKYSMPKHGIVRNSKKPVLKAKNEKSLLFSLKWDEESLKYYPFKFELEIEFTLDGKTLEVVHTISNHGDEPMFYSIGAHPAFNCPLNENEVYEDYYLEFEQTENDSTWEVELSGLIGLDQKPVLNNTSTLPLHKKIFEHDALIFKRLKSRKVTLKHQTEGSILAVDFDDFYYLGLWAKPGAPFICIEPWLGIADSIDSKQKFEEKEGIMELLAGKKDVKTYSITIFE